MIKTYSWLQYPIINIKEKHLSWMNENETNDLVAKTLGYTNFFDLMEESSRDYENSKYDPFLIPDMDKLVERLYAHYKNDSKIVIFGDFDVDGISSSAVLVKALRYLGFNNLDIIIPSREVWYSIKREYIIQYINNPKKKNQYPDLIITVDCGIKSADDISYIVNRLWIEVIVTDHHGVDEQNLPLAASAIVNPHRANSNYPFQEVSGSMVALKTAEWLAEYFQKMENRTPFVRWPQKNTSTEAVMSELRDLAMLWTIADVMPIKDENKWLVKNTLPNIPFTRNPWLKMFVSRLQKEYNDAWNGKLSTDFVGWQIGPRINAAGRIWDPYLWLKMFLHGLWHDDPNVDVDRPLNVKDINEDYNILNSVNKERQEILKEDYTKAVESYNGKKLDKWLVYVNENILDGIIWLIAGRLKEDFYRPTIAIGWKSTNIDLEYVRDFSEEEEMIIYKFLYELNNNFFEKNKMEIFHSFSVKGNKILFSVPEEALNSVEWVFLESIYSIYEVNNILDRFNSDDKLVVLEILEKGLNSHNEIKDYIISQDRYSNSDKSYIYALFCELNETELETLVLFNNEKFKEYTVDEKVYLIKKLSELDFSERTTRFNYITVLKWSCRSVEWFHITEALEYLNNKYFDETGEKLLLWFGGHPLAAWFWIEEWKVSDFKRLFETYANSVIDESILQKEKDVNIEIEDLSVINEWFYNNIYAMWPYGNSNEFPTVFAIGYPRKAEVLWKTKSTVKLYLEDEKWNNIDVMFFRYKDKKIVENFCNAIVQWWELNNKKIWIVWKLNENTFNNVTTINLNAVDVVLDV